MHTYLHLLSPAMHSCVASLREKHLQAAAELETEIDMLEHHGRAMRTAKDATIAMQGRARMRAASRLRIKLAAHLAKATNLTDYDEDAHVDTDWLARAMRSAEPCRRHDYAPTVSGMWANNKKVA